jgi:hypothetical protein
VGEELNSGMREIGSPERYQSVGMTEMDDGVVEVLGHGRAWAEFGTMRSDELTCGGIGVFEISWVALYKVWGVSKKKEGGKTNNRS